MIKLTAVNEILTALGEHPVTEVELKNPTVGVILRALSQECRTVQLRPWWFNEYVTTLYPDNEGVIQTPIGASGWDWIDHPSYISDRYLVDTVNMSSDWRIKNVKSVTGKIRLELEFELLPSVVQEWVTKRALVTAYLNDFGFEEIVGEYQRQASIIEQYVIDTHLQHRKFSTADSPRFQRIRNQIRR